MNKIANSSKFTVAGMLGFIEGLLVYALIVFLLMKILGGGGFILIYAIIGFPFFGIPLALIFVNIAIAREKKKVDKTSTPSERKFTKVFLITSIVVTVILIVAIRIVATNWIKKTVSHPDGYRPGAEKLAAETP